MKKVLQLHKGFTLVETLVAITILTLAIAGTFTAVQGGLQSSTFARDQIVGFYLAQESMEFIKNLRDENAIYSDNAIATGGVGRSWLFGMASTASDPCYFGKTCIIDSPLKTITECTGGFGTCPNIGIDTTNTNLYGYTSGWTPTNFKREIQFQSISDNEVNVIIQISWTSGGNTKSFQVSQLLFSR